MSVLLCLEVSNALRDIAYPQIGIRSLNERF